MEGESSSLYPQCKHIGTPRQGTVTVCWGVSCTMAVSDGLCPILCATSGAFQAPALNCLGMAGANSHLGRCICVKQQINQKGHPRRLLFVTNLVLCSSNFNILKSKICRCHCSSTIHFIIQICSLKEESRFVYLCRMAWQD